VLWADGREFPLRFTVRPAVQDGHRAAAPPVRDASSGPSNSCNKTRPSPWRVSKDEQKRRFLERLDRPEKHWKFSTSDLPERAFWDTYMEGYEDALAATTTEEAPWSVVPADNKWVTRAVVADVITTAIRSLDRKYPEVTEEKCKAIAAREAS
jgi:hypothetical protein